MYTTHRVHYLFLCMIFLMCIVDLSKNEPCQLSAPSDGYTIRDCRGNICNTSCATGYSGVVQCNSMSVQGCNVIHNWCDIPSVGVDCDTSSCSRTIHSICTPKCSTVQQPIVCNSDHTWSLFSILHSVTADSITLSWTSVESVNVRCNGASASVTGTSYTIKDLEHSTVYKCSVSRHGHTSDILVRTLDAPVVLSIDSITTQRVGLPFLSTVTASNDSYSGVVSLSSVNGLMSPAYIQITNGRWSGYITLYEASNDNQLILDKNDGSNCTYSNDFDVVDGLLTTADSILEGIVLDQHHNPIENAEVQLVAKSKRSEASVKTNKQGKFTINAMPGSYSLLVSAPGHQSVIDTVQLPKLRKLSWRGKLNTAVGRAMQIPVVYVPGIFGSCYSSCAFVYPGLKFPTPPWNSKDWQLFSPRIVGWHALTEALLSHYPDGAIHAEAAYDWTLHTDLIVDQFLIPHIDGAKKFANSAVVDIVAHSLGGIVARAYIQSSKYRGDVRKLALVGTPNFGSDNMYYPSSGDTITADWHGGAHDNYVTNVYDYYYSNALYDIARDMSYPGHSKLVEFRWDHYYPERNNHTGLALFLTRRLHAGSNFVLLPTYDDALLDSNSQSIPIVALENTYLKALNGQRCLSDPKGRCMSVDKQTEYVFKPYSSVLSDKIEPGKVQTHIFYGTSGTGANLHHIYTQPKSSVNKQLKMPERSYSYNILGTPLFDDGVPNEYLGNGQNTIVRADGDGTVIAASAILPGLPAHSAQGTHSNLVGVFADKLVSFISSSTLTADAPTVVVPEPPRLVLQIFGRVQPEMFASDSVVGEYEYALTHSSIKVTAPQNGTYTVLLKCPYDESFELEVCYIDELSRLAVCKRSHAFYDVSMTSFSFVLEGSTLTFDDRMNRPSIDMDNKDDRVYVYWSTVAGADHYDIYSKNDDEPTFKYIGSTDNNDMHTNDGWDNKDTVSYSVRAVYSDGDSTFMAPAAYYKGDGHVASDACTRSYNHAHTVLAGCLCVTGLAVIVAVKKKKQNKINSLTEALIN